jgi:hypothetical protein
MCALVWSYAKELGIRCSLINNGDDCVVFMNRRDGPRFSECLDAWFAELGFTMQVEPPVYEIEKIEFCQARPVYVGPSYLMVRNVHSCMAKDSVCLSPINHPKQLTAWCAAVGAAGTAMYGGVPVLDAYYQWYFRSGERVAKWEVGRPKTGHFLMAERMTRRGMPVTDATRLSFYVAFGILPDMQVLLERHFAGLPPVPTGMPIHPIAIFPELRDFPHHWAITQALQHQSGC